MSSSAPDLPAAVRAFDAVAGDFDARFGAWKSVAAQRRAVRRELLAAFPPGANLLELGGGTGEDALFLALSGRNVLMTDGSPAMAARAAAKARERGLGERVPTRVLALEDLPSFAEERARAEAAPFDGAFSNFASLNCVSDLSAVGRALARLLRPKARALLVVFGTACPGEFLVELARRRPAAALRRLARGPVPARISGNAFSVAYPSAGSFRRAFAPGLRLRRTVGIGVFVPPSAAEPWISSHPRLLSGLEAADRVFARPLARLGDHVLLDFERTETAA